MHHFDLQYLLKKVMYRCDFWHTNKQTKRKKLRLCFEWLGQVCTIIPKFLNFREERLNWCAKKSIVWNVKAFRRSVLNRFCNVKFLSQLNCKILLSDLQEKSNYYCNILYVDRHPETKWNLNHFFGFNRPGICWYT